MASWANLFGYQATWFAVAWSAGHGRAWIGMLACIAFIGVQWRCSHARRADARVVLAALACGLLVDGIAAATGLLAYASAFPALPAPAWIVLLWCAFAMTMNHSMAWFAPRPWPAAAFAAVGGPLAYLGAARGFGALAFRDPAWPALLYLGSAWAVALPLLLRVASGGSRAARAAIGVRA